MESSPEPWWRSTAPGGDPAGSRQGPGSLSHERQGPRLWSREATRKACTFVQSLVERAFTVRHECHKIMRNSGSPFNTPFVQIDCCQHSSVGDACCLHEVACNCAVKARLRPKMATTGLEFGEEALGESTRLALAWAYHLDASAIGVLADTRAGCGPLRQTSTNVGPETAEICQMSANSGPLSAKFGPNLARPLGLAER